MHVSDRNGAARGAGTYQGSAGYTLIELALVILVAGLVLAPAAGIYGLYIKNKRIDQTQMAVQEARTAIGDFKAIFGRYPCPARRDAVPGDADYGYESRNPGTGVCIDAAGSVEKVTSANTALSNQDVFIGSVPFRQMNLSSNLVEDGYGSRLTYAVTGLLTNDTTFSNNNGGIGIIDTGPGFGSLIDPPDTAHFVVISHNKDSAGAISAVGVMVGACPTGLQRENCDYTDARFRAGQVRNDFDDIVYYNTTDSVEQWQISNVDDQSIHLRRATNMAMGVGETDSTAGFSTAEIKETVASAGDSVLLVSPDPMGFTPGALQVGEICRNNGVDCFDPALIGGQIASMEGMECPAGQFLVGIANESPICRNEIFFTCPAGKFAAGFDASGRLICNALPPLACPDQTLTTTCGDSRNVSASVLDAGIWYGYGYGGECYRIGPLDTGVIAAVPSIWAAVTYVNALNAIPRTAEDCGPTYTTAMTRDTFRCNSSTGTWNAVPVYTTERETVSGDTIDNEPPISGGYVAETTVPYNAVTPMAVDPANNQSNHDCWCREDYRVWVTDCSMSAARDSFRVMRRTCPVTTPTWTQVYPASGYDSHLCTCVAGTVTTNPTCKAHFGYSGIGITGNVTLTYDRACPSGTLTLINTDTSNCQCPAMVPDKNYTTTNCPLGTTNSFTYDGVPYVGKAEVYRSDWQCPGGSAPQPASSSADAGSYTAPTLVHTEACVCDTALTQTHVEACPMGSLGTGKTYILPWNCTTGAFDPPSDSNLVSNDCHACIWQAGTPESGLSEFAAPVQKGAGCASCSGTSACYETVATGRNPYQRYTGCYCAPQP